MPTQIELTFASMVQKAVADVKRLESGLESLKGEAKSVSGTLDNVAAATNQFGAAGGTVAAGMQVARTAIQATAAAVQGATIVITMLVGAFDFAEKAAQRYGNTKVADQINKMHAAFDSYLGVMLELPVAGKSVLQWMGDAAEGAGNLFKLVGVLGIKFKEFTGEITAAEAATMAAKLVNDEYSKSLATIYDSATAAKKALADMQKELVASGEYAGNYRVVKKGSGASERFVIVDASGKEVQMPGRAIGGPVAANQPVLVGERRPEIFIPDRPGKILPNTNGLSGMGGAVVSQTTVVNVQAGAFLGDRADALQVANKLAPQITRANQRAATGGLKR